jgi:hypothetical protein
MSPQADALNSIRVGDVLRVGLQRVQEHRFVAVLDPAGRIVGTVGSDRAIQLIDCLDRGYTYAADVLGIDGGACRVLIRHSDR